MSSQVCDLLCNQYTIHYYQVQGGKEACQKDQWDLDAFHLLSHWLTGKTTIHDFQSANFLI